MPKGAASLAAIPPAVFDSARPCSHCLMSKMRKKSLKMSSASQRSDKRVVMDVWGPFKVPSAEYKYQYLVGFTHDETTGFTAVYSTVDHTADTLVHITRRYRGDMAKHENFDMRILRTDNGAEMCSEKYQTYLADSLISWERSAPYVHEQVGLQERRWGIIIPRATAMLKQGGARLGHWASAARYAAHLVNLEPLSRYGDHRSTIERLTGCAPDLAPVRTFWARMWGALAPEQRAHKFADRAVEGRFVGLAANGSAWVLYSTNLPRNRHFTVVQATFDEADLMWAATTCVMAMALPGKLSGPWLEATKAGAKATTKMAMVVMGPLAEARLLEFLRVAMSQSMAEAPETVHLGPVTCTGYIRYGYS
jgi:hypothetical protein